MNVKFRNTIIATTVSLLVAGPSLADTSKQLAQDTLDALFGTYDAEKVGTLLTEDYIQTILPFQQAGRQ